MRVCKFGGTSLCDAAAFRQAGAIVRAESDRRILVVSAPGRREPGDEKLTDLLYACQAAAAAGQPFGHLFDRAAGRFRQIAEQLGLPPPNDALRQVYQGLQAGAPAAWAASRGEWLCAGLFSQYLQLPLLDAAEVIRFDAAGALQADATLSLLRKALGRLPGCVLPGFYGADGQGTVHTFPRGGSDVTAALAAAAVNADVYENWKDVRGVFAADPALVPDARCIADMSYGELRVLSRLGARVLHEDAVAPVRQAGIPLNIRSSAEPRHPGTWIHAAFGPAERPAAIGVTGLQEVSLLRAECLNGGWKLAAEALAAPGNLLRLAADEDALCLLLKSPDALPAALTETAQRLRRQEHLAALSVVGSGLGRAEGAARFSAALSAAGIPVLSLHQPPEGLYMTAVIAQADYSPGIRAAYDAFLRP